MPNTIDQNVVQMRFDNAQFESGIQTSLSSLNKLRQNITLGGATSGLTSSIETISSRFSTMGIIGVTALQRITNAAIDTGSRMLKSLTIEPVKTGLSEYEEKINSVQTILMGAKNKNGTAVSLEQVKDKLEELNTYADKTIYSFHDMTANIGKFTNAGVDLDTSVAAIQGVANVAAVSGANAQQASHAMYNFAQALSSGYVKLIDWKSIEVAGMATQDFKKQLIESAVAAGTLEKTSDGMYKVLTKNGQGSTMKETINATKNFNDSLGYQWMTTEVLTKTLGKYSDESTDVGKKAMKAAQDVKTFTQLLDVLREAAQSGWAMTWEYIIGDFEQAKKVWTTVNKEIGGMIDASSKSRNELIKGWVKEGGRKALFNSVKNAWNAFMDVATNVKEAFREVFPAMTSKRLADITKKIEELTSKLTMSTEDAENFNATFRGIFSVFDLIKQAISAVIRVFLPFSGVLTGFASSILESTGNIGDFIFNVDQTVRKNDTFYKSLKKLADFITGSSPFKILKSGIETLLGGFESMISKLSIVKDNVVSFFKSLSEGSSETAGKTTNVFSTLLHVISLIGTALLNAAKAIKDALLSALDGLNLEEVEGLMSGGLLTFILFGFQKFTKALSKFTEQIVGFNIIENISKTFDALQNTLVSFQNNVKASTIFKIAAAVAILTGALVILSGIDSNAMNTSFAAITGLFVDLLGSLALFDKIVSGKNSMKKLSQAGSGLLKLSIAITIMASALKKLSTIPTESLGYGLLAIIGLTETLVISAIVLNKLGGKGASKAAKGMITMSIALNIMASAVKKIADLDPERLGQGLFGVGALLAELGLFISLTDFAGAGVRSGLSILIIAEALKVLTSVVSTLGSIDANQVSQALFSIGALLGELGLFTTFTAGTKGMMASAVSLTIMASGIKILVEALNTLTTSNFDQMGNSLIMLAGALGMMVLALNAANGGVAGAASILIIATALSILAPVIQAFSNMSLEQIAKGLGLLAGSLIIFGVAGALLAPIAPALLAVSGAFLLLGVGIASIGAGLTLVATGFISLAAALTANVASVVASITAIAVGVVSFIPVVATAIAKGILVFIATIANNGAKMVDAAVKLGTALLDGLKTLGPALINTGLYLIVSLMQGINDNIQQITVLALSVLTNFITGLTEGLPALAEAGITMITTFINSMAQGINERGPELITAFTNLFKSVGNLLIEELANIAEMIPGVGKGIADKIRSAKMELDGSFTESDGQKATSKYAKGAAKGIEDLPKKAKEKGNETKKNLEESVSGGNMSGAMQKLLKPVDKALDSVVKKFGTKGKEASKALSSSIDTGESAEKVKNSTKKIEKSATVKADTGKSSKEGQKQGDAYAEGIEKSAGKVKTSTAKLASNGAKGFSSKKGEFTSSGRSTASGLISGLNSMMGALRAKGASMANAVNSSYRSNLKVSSPSRVMIDNAKCTIMGLIKGFADNLPNLRRSANRVGGVVKQSISNAIQIASDAFSGELNSEPTITPIIDLSNVRRGISFIDSSLGAKTLALSPSVAGFGGMVNANLASIQNGANNADVVSAIGKLRKDIANIQPNVTNVNGVTYDDGSNIVGAVETLVRAATVEGRT